MSQASLALRWVVPIFSFWKMLRRSLYRPPPFLACWVTLSLERLAFLSSRESKAGASPEPSCSKSPTHCFVESWRYRSLAARKKRERKECARSANLARAEGNASSRNRAHRGSGKHPRERFPLTPIGRFVDIAFRCATHTDHHYPNCAAGGNAELERVARNLLSTCPSPP